MKPLNLNCPKNAWPQFFSGVVILGIIDSQINEPVSIWIILDIISGDVHSVNGIAAPGGDIPEEVLGYFPVLMAIADRSIWELLVSNRSKFYEGMSTGLIKLSGDFRLFGRVTPGLINVIERTNFWSNLDDVMNILQSPA